ncbi:MAG TPA: class I SAM-dependent methyltransferase [Micromonosporaceae bacterium]|nr:class I SAM-dependent methyltransferase [Micromonosporaceae bacterium]
MPDEGFEHPRLIGLYDYFEGDRADLAEYVKIVDEVGGRSVLDLGCGTGTFALLLADRSIEVIGVDPAAGSLAVARAKRGADRVRWIHGDARSVPADVRVDVVAMTGNVAQAIFDEADWDATLRGAYTALHPGGYLVFETRDPAFRAWQDWNRESSYQMTDIPGVGRVETWVDLTGIEGQLVSFRWTWVFASDGQAFTSDSTLRFRERDEVRDALLAHGYTVQDVRDAPDRPGREFVFLARRPR